MCATTHLFWGGKKLAYELRVGGGGGVRMSVEKRKRKKHGQASDGDRGGDVRDDGLRWGTETRNTQTAG